MAYIDNPLIFTSRGNIELLSQNKTAVFVSRQIPDSMFEDIRIFFNALMQLPIGLAGGWQSPAEKRLYKTLSPSMTANVIHYFARDINQMALTPLQQSLLDEQKLLMVAPETNRNRANKALIKKRDELIFSQNKKICFLYIRQGGLLEEYFNRLHQSGYFIYLFDHKENEPFKTENVVLLHPDNLEMLITLNG